MKLRGKTATAALLATGLFAFSSGALATNGYVITSYSIHYTKLYELGIGGRGAAPRPAGGPGRGPLARADTSTAGRGIVSSSSSSQGVAVGSVAVAGDFTDWQPSFTLDDPDGDGVWSGRIPVRPGVHAYMFLVDEREWIV